jgi:hypothetical protein
MAHTLYRVTVIDHDYHYTTYTTWVSASSKNQAIAMGAALIGGEKTRREAKRMNREPYPVPLLFPEVKLESVDVDEYYAHLNEVQVSGP